jgi:signal transduction histidine kinase/CheY-like chemotaxis protein
MRTLIPQLSILILCSLLSAVCSAGPVILSDEQGTYPLGLHLELLNDPGEQWTVQDVNSPTLSSHFVPSPIQEARFTENVGWARFTITNKATKTEEWLLVDTRIGSPDRVELYIPDVVTGAPQSWSVKTLGDAMPASHRAVKYRRDNFLLNLEPDTTRTFYVRYEFGRNGRETSLVLYSFRDFAAHDHESQIALGLFFGLMGVMVLYNLFLFLSLKDRAYLYYVLSMATVGMLLAMVNGVFQEHLLPGFATKDTRINLVFMGIYWIFQSKFMQTFLRTRSLVPWIHRMLSVYIISGVFTVIAALLDLQAILVPRAPQHIFGLVFFALNIIVPLLCLRRGFRPARFFLFASSLMVTGALLYTLERLNILPAIALFQYYSMHLGVALETILFSLALADRIKILREEKETQEAASREAQLSARTAQAANQAKSRFLANMSHEIRTPMNAILGYAQILQRKSTLAPDDRQAVETIHRSGDHLLKLINDVLDISKIEAGRLELQPSDFDLQSLLQNLSVMFQHRCEAKGLTWSIESPRADRIPVHGDEAKLSQVLINLLGNAVKFTPQGSVSLKVSSLPDHHFRFDVTDTGPGISLEDQSSIFEAFAQSEAGRREGGTGLGLSISQRLLDLMGGKLELKSPRENNMPAGLSSDSSAVLSAVASAKVEAFREGGGSTFAFTIALPPAKAEVSASTGDEWSSVTHLAEGHTVSALVADDVIENRDVLSHLLTDIGVEVTLAENGKEALDQVLANPPDILFLDIRMPVMDGQEAARRIWEEIGRDTTKIVAVSASTLDHERQEIFDLGFNGFLPKPFRTEQIYASLAEHLGVEFDYDEASVASDQVDLDLSEISLPDDLRERLVKAAELSSVTELEQTLDEVQKIGPEAGRLATHLRSLSQDFKMDEILTLLRKI